MRDSIHEILRYASKNKLPDTLKDQMMAHMQLKFKTVEMQQDEVFQDLPKAIRSSISLHLFKTTVDKTYLFQDISEDLIIQLISEMKAEYFPPKVDIIIQTEIPTDFYILVSGEVELLAERDGTEKFLSKLGPADMAGEIGVFFNIPQPFTVRTKRLSQVIRISHQHFKQVVESDVKDGKKIIRNFLQYLKRLKNEILEEIPCITDLLGDQNNEHIIPNAETPSSEASIICDVRHVHFEEEPTSSTTRHLPMRLVIHGHHPDDTNTMESNKLGKLIHLPKTIEELLQLAELFLYTKGNDVYLWKCNTTTLMPMITSDFDDLGKVMGHLDLIGGRDAVFDWERSYYNDLVAYISSRRLLVNNQGLVIAELQIFGQDGKMDESELPFYIRSLDVLSLKPFGLRDRTIPSRTVRYLERDGRAAPVEESTTTTATTSTELDDENRAGLLKQVAELIAVNKILENDKEAANKQVTELKDANRTLKSEKEAAEKQLTELKDVAAQITAAEKAQQERDEAKRDKEAAERKVVELQTQIDNKKEVWMNDLSDSGWSTTESLAPYVYGFLAVSSGITTLCVNVAAQQGTFTVDDNTTNVRASFLYRVTILDMDGDRAVYLRARYKTYKAVKLEELSPSKEKARFDSLHWVCCKYNGVTYVIKKEM